MLVRCVNNKLSAVAPQSAIGQELSHWFSLGTDMVEDLTVGNWYTVYLIEIWKNYPWYAIADDLYEHLQYPIMYASIFFDEVDSRVSSCWSIGYRDDSAKLEQMEKVCITFKEWADDAMFFERLIDGNDREVEIFQRYKAFMDMEYPSPSIADEAKLLEGAWLMCPYCIDAWESQSALGMVSCPKCCTTLLNPLYSPPSFSAECPGLD